MKQLIALVLSACCANAPAYEMTMTAVEKAQCVSQGGCAVITIERIQEVMRTAYRAGQSTCESQL